ncbi:MAG: hypothetical protein ABFD64_01620 [Armatimonadota bacterium]
MSEQFWRLFRKNESLRGVAEWDHEAMTKIEQQFPGVRIATLMCPATHPVNIPTHVLLTSKHINDFIFSVYGACMIKDCVLQMFRNEGFTGLNVLPIVAKMKSWRSKNVIDSIEIPKLWEVFATGWGGMAKPQSGIHLLSDRGGFLRYSDLEDSSNLIDENQWDGSDFFIVWPMPRYLFVSDRVARFIMKHKLTGVKLIRVESLRDSIKYSTLGYSPGRLRAWLPEPKAKEIGEPLNIY